MEIFVDSTKHFSGCEGTPDVNPQPAQSRSRRVHTEATFLPSLTMASEQMGIKDGPWMEKR